MSPLPDIVALKHISRIIRYCWVVLTSLSVWYVGVASPPTCSALKYWLGNEKQEMRSCNASQQYLRILLTCFRATMSVPPPTAVARTPPRMDLARGGCGWRFVRWLVGGSLGAKTGYSDPKGKGRKEGSRF